MGNQQKRLTSTSDLHAAKTKLQEIAQQHGNCGTVGVIINKSAWTLQEIQIHDGCGRIVAAPPKKIYPGAFAPFYHANTYKTFSGPNGSITFKVLHNKPGGNTQMEIYWQTHSDHTHTGIGGDLFGNADIELTVSIKRLVIVNNGQNCFGYVWIIR